MCVTSSQGEGYQTLESENLELSIYRNKKYTQKSTAKQDDSINSKSTSFAAASSKLDLEEEKNQKGSNPYSERLTAFPGQNKKQSEQNKRNSNKEKRVPEIDYTVNKKLIALLDSAGVPINRTIKDLLKLYSKEKVERAIAILRARKREKRIPKPSGYFVAALKGDWSSTNVDNDSEGDQGVVFRHWYDLARELGYCSGQEVREGQQWVCLSGSWKKWSDAVNRGYSLNYLQKIMKRNQSR